MPAVNRRFHPKRFQSDPAKIRIRAPVSRRVSFLSSYSYRVSDRNDFRFVRNRASMGFDVGLTRDLSLRLMYRYTEARYPGRIVRTHSPDVGLDFHHALELSTGVHFEARCSHPDLVPGQQFEVVVSLLNRGNEPLGIRRVSFIAPSGWTIQSAMPVPPALSPQDHVELKYKGVVPDHQPTSRPPWERRNKSQSLYSVSDQSLTNSSTIPLPLIAQLEYSIGGTPVQLKTPVETLRVLRRVEAVVCHHLDSWRVTLRGCDGTSAYGVRAF